MAHNPIDNLGLYGKGDLVKSLGGPGAVVAGLIGGGAVLGTVFGVGAMGLGIWGLHALKKHSTATLMYPAVFDNADNDGQYTVTFPDVPDTVSQGATLEEALTAAPNALAVALPDYVEYPTPSSFEEVKTANPGLIVQMVSVTVPAK
ncbi:type II toxin-antitoxin system HicB family antitoxin [Lacticaseibacillus daqingensis]|uniref:type II toxin-antitoxin system HicB family antitoxin n=1 Tax=Lacticaseibacillus daqingensis TaxID=2486014 RepID=UPI001CDC8192|nr:type II toxin-antitoxin system HicB family antitoxin [Lacticaseibacillus daqingensis]